MPRRSRGVSIFTALPRDIKQTLRSNPRIPQVLPASPPRTPNEADLLPTQPASSDRGDDDAEEQDGGAEGDGGEAAWGEAQGVALDSANTAPATALITPGSPLKRAATDNDAMTPPTKKHKGKEKEETHPWDCTGLVPRYDTAEGVPGHLKKYFYQRHALFPAYSRLPLLLDDIGWFSVTPAAIADHLAERCRCDVIVDAFCGVGGNAIAFARTCERVIAMDIDPTRLRLARHNALHYGVADRIEFVLADYVAWAREYARRGAAEREVVDVVFLSPPWGGPEYLGVPAYPLSAIEPIPGDELFAVTAAVSPNIAYFLPRNVDVAEVAALATPLDGPESDGGSTGAETRRREWVEIEEQWVGDKLKANAAYFGGLVQ